MLDGYSDLLINVSELMENSVTIEELKEMSEDELDSLVQAKIRSIKKNKDAWEGREMKRRM